MIKAESICRTFRQADSSLFRALDNVSLEISDGDTLVIAGANGSGKSLLMRIISGLEKPSSGTVESSGPVGLVFQDPDAQILADTPLEDVLFSLSSQKGLSKAQAREKALQALEQAGIADRKDSPAHLLSGGEKRRLAIASVLALGRNTVIFDEPYSNLDYPGVKSVNAMIGKLQEEGFTIVILTHELEKCLGLANRFAVLSKGKLAYDGPASEALKLDLGKWGIRNPLPGGDPGELVWR
ncbi:MAG: ABC transporter ATP-binding protein [Spirochaetales bacterium]|nr:ABC transporter ATP-binding protein [Spirochaetales bacterium]